MRRWRLGHKERTVSHRGLPMACGMRFGEYEEQLGCVIRQHRLGFELVALTERSRSNVVRTSLP